MSDIVSGHTYTDIHALWARCQRIEARQRAYGMHDPNCPAFKSMLAQQHTSAYVIPQPCTCWLSEESGS